MGLHEKEDPLVAQPAQVSGHLQRRCVVIDHHVVAGPLGVLPGGEGAVHRRHAALAGPDHRRLVAAEPGDPVDGCVLHRGQRLVVTGRHAGAA